MRIAIGSDHAGFELKEDIKTYLKEQFSDYEVIDFGAKSLDSTSYAIYGAKVGEAVVDNVVDRGIVICGTGIGISMTVGRMRGTRVALCHDAYTARMSRLHNDANILALGGRTVGKCVALDIVRVWLNTHFEGGRHGTRISQVDTLTSALARYDSDIAEAIAQEYDRQRSKLELIASENYASRAVREAQRSVMTNKYAEGYPGKRYYGGCDFVDIVETLAIERAKKLFKADHVNVQPHSGSQANMQIYYAALNLGDTVLGMNLAHGGHLTHGSPVNMSGKHFNVISYGVDKDTEQIDFREVRELAHKHKPKMIVVGASAYPRIIEYSKFREIADEVGAYVMADIAHISGIIVAGLHPSPVSYAEFITSTTHKTLRGPRGGMLLCQDPFKQMVDKAVFPGTQGGPLMHVIAAKAVAFKEALQPSFKTYQQQIVKNARALADELQRLGFRLVSGGTDTHLLLVDLTPQDVTGKVAETVLENAGITLNKNMIPFDTRSPFVTSGIRIGTPAITTRGMKEDDMRRIALWICRALSDVEDGRLHKQIAHEVHEFCSSFPLHYAG